MGGGAGRKGEDERLFAYNLCTPDVCMPFRYQAKRSGFALLRHRPGLFSFLCGISVRRHNFLLELEQP